MHEQKKYHKIIFFIEACFSGSMFESLLPNNISAYVMTAAHAHEVSWACYYDEYRDAWLGDSFSVNWMEDADQQDLHKQTLHQLYNIVKKKTTKSHVQHYGEMATESLHLSEFMGNKNVTPVVLSNFSCDPVSSADLPIHVLEHKINTTENSTLKRELEEQKKEIFEKRDMLGGLFVELVSAVGADVSVLNTKPGEIEFPCYENVTDAFSEKCSNISSSPYTAAFLFGLVNLCANYTTETIIETIQTVCPRYQISDVI
ncbi:hypothetical protein HPB48_017495 [Haemaphysalis longicornis]|uniref:Legumain n=1 Tax=Haemaphysalis longicornis TaxID=44386 RepID=A0A9J6G7T8_HAELO|nr:hypothetical protein HPB48_017495 [Haemaphysalis longicornis]